MALLDMAYQSGAYLECAHVNYHKRPTADRDEKIVRSYCKRKHIVFHLYDFEEERYHGNFQAAARDARYDFFARICKRNKLDEVLIAHHKDDLIETYLMQKERKLEVSYYGLKQYNIINGVKVYRPLLSYDKKMLEKYCIDQDIPYGIDESNLEDDYTRNKIRHQVVEKMSEKQKDVLIEQIDEENKKKEERYKIASGKLDRKDYSVSAFMRTPYLKYYLYVHFPHRSKSFYKEMLRQLKESDYCIFEGKDICISKEYSRIHIFERCFAYAQTFNSLAQLKRSKSKYYKIANNGRKIEGFCLHEDDFPLTIRTYEEGDKIALRFGHKKINRFFIDSKFTYEMRKTWPLLVNVRGEVIFVPGIGCDVDHYCEKPDTFMIKL